MFDFKGKVAIVTGGTRGIGAAVSRMLAQGGASVMAAYSGNIGRAEQLKQEITSAGGKCQVFGGDLCLTENCEGLVEATLAEFGAIDILVNNHGIWNDGPLESMSLETWDELMNVNLRSVFYLTQLVSIKMIARGSGKIINVSSTAAQRGEAFHSHYAASKGAINSFTKSLSSELAPRGINVNAVAPGWVYTDMTEETFADKELERKIVAGIPIGRVPSAEDIAGPIVFLASEMARHISGEIMNVNGGAVLCG